MRVLVTGASGLLGGNILQLLHSSWNITGIVYTHGLRAPSGGTVLEMNLLEKEIEEIFKNNPPFDAVIHTAAFTNVDLCEMQKRHAWEVNALLTHRLANVCKKYDTYLCYISTDHIFDGKKGGYEEESTPHPVNYYAETKLAAEEFVRASGVDAAIIRTNFFGYYINEKRGIAGWIVETLQAQEKLTLFSDVHFSPILVNTLVGCIAEIVEQRMTGTLHVASTDSCSKEEFGRKLAQAFSLSSKNIIPMLLKDSHLRVPRPMDMSLSSQHARALLKTRFGTVDESIAEYRRLADIGYPIALRHLSSVPV